MSPTPTDLRRIEIACAVSAAVFGAAFVALVALTFIDSGRALLSLIGG